MEYAINNKIEDKPAFAWWVTYILKKRKAIVSKIKSKYWQRTHKYGIRVPKSVDEALRRDQDNGNDYWKVAIELEMKKINDAFEIYNVDTNDLV